MKRKAVLAASILIVVLLVILVWQRLGIESGVYVSLDDFLERLPAGLSEQQAREVRSTLELFEQAYREGQIAPNDHREIVRALEHYVSKGEVTKEELQELMAWVGYYYIRMKQENLDESGRIKPPDHPLLEGKFKDPFPVR